MYTMHKSEKACLDSFIGCIEMHDISVMFKLLDFRHTIHEILPNSDI